MRVVSSAESICIPGDGRGASSSNDQISIRVVSSAHVATSSGLNGFFVWRAGFVIVKLSQVYGIIKTLRL